VSDTVTQDARGWFAEFLVADAPRLRQVLVARFGADVGGESFADSVAWAWAHRDELRDMTNPVGYLFRVAQSSARRHRRWTDRVLLIDVERSTPADDVDVDLLVALAALNDAQRVAVVLVHSHGWSYAEVAETLDVGVDAVRNHVHRGLRRLRTLLGEDT
jgi:DNA-directed RNA polymerase specialized sigma24 family protein